MRKDQGETQKSLGHGAQVGKVSEASLASLILTFLMSSEVIGFPCLSIAPSATMMILRREPRVLVCSRAKRKQRENAQ